MAFIIVLVVEQSIHLHDTGSTHVHTLTIYFKLFNIKMMSRIKKIVAHDNYNVFTTLSIGSPTMLISRGKLFVKLLYRQE